VRVIEVHYITDAAFHAYSLRRQSSKRPENRQTLDNAKRLKVEAKKKAELLRE
jgi:hypothetical protein